MPTTELTAHQFVVGIDVAEETLQVAVPASGRSWNVPNTASGHTHLVEELGLLAPDATTWVVVVEATGGWELAVAWALQAAGAEVRRVNPQTAHELRRRLKGRAKTDRLDAEALTLVPALAVPCAPFPTPAESALQGLLHHRASLVAERVQIQLRLRGPQVPPLVQHQLATRRLQLTSDLSACELAIEEAVKATPEGAAKLRLLQSLPGIGRWTATEMVAACPLLGTGVPKAVASFVGVAPHPVDSGRLTGPRRTGGGHARLRCLLYMAALTACRHNPVIAAFAARLRARGKRGKVVIVACMHKLLTLADHLVYHGIPWSPPVIPNA